MLKLEIPDKILEQIVAQAKAQAPVEVCGILAGKGDVVEKFYEMTNVDNSNDHFMMDPAEQFGIVKNMRAAGVGMLAIYHSHPETPARPSAEDIRLALTSEVIYVIISLQGTEPVVKGFLIDNDNVKEVPVNIVEK